jgi:hypothetical protein
VLYLVAMALRLSTHDGTPSDPALSPET